MKRLFPLFYLLIVLSIIFLIFFRLGSTTLVNWDEAWLASVAQDIAVRNDWLGGQWNGQTWFYEPPLVTWALAVIYKIFGPQEFWLRSFNAALGLLIVILTFWLTILITKSAKSDLISVIILIADIEFLFRSRQINVEIPVTFFLFLTIYALCRCEDPRHTPGRRGNLGWWIAAGGSLGLAFLTKRASPILILPAIAYSLYKYRNWRYLFIIFITLITITFPWFVINYFKWGDQFVNEFFLGYTLGKIRSVNPTAGSNIFFYFTALRHAFKFWFPLIPIVLVWAAVKSFRDRKIAVLTICIFSFLIFLTLAPIKSSWFLLPTHPPLTILTGLFIANLVKFTKLHTRMRSFANFPILLIILISIGQLLLYRNNFIVPDTTRHQARMAKLANKLTPPGQPLYLDDGYLPVAVFYSQRRVIPLRFDRLQPLTPLPIPAGSFILTNRQTLPALTNQYPNLTLVSTSGNLLIVK